jgi:hypothetical protein
MLLNCIYNQLEKLQNVQPQQWFTIVFAIVMSSIFQSSKADTNLLPDQNHLSYILMINFKGQIQMFQCIYVAGIQDKF